MRCHLSAEVGEPCNAHNGKKPTRAWLAEYRAAVFFFLRCSAVLCVVLHAKAARMRCMPVGHGIRDGESTWWPTVSAMRAGALPGASEIPLGILKNWLALLAPADFSANLRARFHLNRGRCGLRRCGAATHFPGFALLCGRPLPGLGSAFAPCICVRLRCTTLVEVVVVPFAAATFALRALPLALPAGLIVEGIGPVCAGCTAPVLLPSIWPVSRCGALLLRRRAGHRPCGHCVHIDRASAESGHCCLRCALWDSGRHMRCRLLRGRIMTCTCRCRAGRRRGRCSARLCSANQSAKTLRQVWALQKCRRKLGVGAGLEDTECCAHRNHCVHASAMQCVLNESAKVEKCCEMLVLLCLKVLDCGT